jgi:hypothetical protein
MLADLRRARYGTLLACHILRLWAAQRNPTEIAAMLFCSRSTVYFGDSKSHNPDWEAWLSEHRPGWRIEVKNRPEGGTGFPRYRNAGW